MVSGKNNSRNVGENLTEWEGSPSSDDQDTDHGNLYPQSSQIKYIPINYFEYFDNANLDSDEFSSSSLVGCEHPPALPVDEMRCSPGQSFGMRLPPSRPRGTWTEGALITAALG